MRRKRGTAAEIDGGATGYVLERDETAEAGFRRLSRLQIDRALAAISNDAIPLDTRIHEVRKRLKEGRAVARMFRPALAGSFDEENAWYRDLGRQLAGFRDATAALEAIEKFRPVAIDTVGSSAYRSLHRAARAQKKERFGDGSRAAEALNAVQSALPFGVARAHDASLAAEGFDALAEGVRGTLASCERAVERAEATGDAADVHEWRKRVKDHWYHVQLLIPIWPRLMKARAAELGDLSRALGDHHDLVLVAALARDAAGADDQARLSDFVKVRQDDLLDAAVERARRLHSAKPRQTVEQWARLWRVWKGE